MVSKGVSNLKKDPSDVECVIEDFFRCRNMYECSYN